MNAMRKTMAAILRLLIGLGLIVFLFRVIGWESIRLAVAPARQHPLWIVAAIGLTGLALLMGVVRWHAILRTLALPTAFGRTLRGYFVGQFFNAFLFGACGGDLARAVFAAHDHPDRRAEAVTSVFLDRAIGLFVTLLFGCGMLLARFPRVAGSAAARPAIWLMAVFPLAAAACIALFFTRNLFERLPWLRRLEERGRTGQLLRRAYDAVFLFRQNLRHLRWPAILSIANLLLLAAATAVLARALEMRLAFLDLLVVFPIATVLAAIPLTPGSLGVRETLYVQLLQPSGIAAGPALMLSLLGYLAGTFWSLTGAAPLLAPRLRAAANRTAPAQPTGRADVDGSRA